MNTELMKVFRSNLEINHSDFFISGSDLNNLYAQGQEGKT